MLILALALSLGCSFVQAAGAAASEPALSVAEATAIHRQIQTLNSPVDRSVAEGWSNAKKVAELLCRPTAQKVLRKQSPGADRVFLGTEDPTTLSLQSNQLLSGTGSARNRRGWQEFAFTCAINPATGKISGFTAILIPVSK